MKRTLVPMAGLFTLFAVAAQAESAGAVYTQTNAASGNSVVMLSRSGDGTLAAPRYFPTGGLGAGASLGSQGSVTLADNGHWLFVVNAGSNDISTFSIDSDGSPALRSRTLSGGVMPISVTVHGDTVFVLNAGGTPNITGFDLSRNGDLTPIPGAARNLQGAGPAEVLFDDHGEQLVVTDKTSNQLEVFEFDDGKLHARQVAASSGLVPFGFAFAHRDVLVVSEATGSAVSSYRLDDGRLTPISASIPDTQRAACWVVVTRNGKFAYVANAQTSTVSAYSVAPNGSLTLLAAIAGSTPAGTGPTDLALSRSSTQPLLARLRNHLGIPSLRSRRARQHRSRNGIAKNHRRLGRPIKSYKNTKGASIYLPQEAPGSSSHLHCAHKERGAFQARMMIRRFAISVPIASSGGILAPRPCKALYPPPIVTVLSRRTVTWNRLSPGSKLNTTPLVAFVNTVGTGKVLLVFPPHVHRPATMKSRAHRDHGHPQRDARFVFRRRSFPRCGRRHR